MPVTITIPAALKQFTAQNIEIVVEALNVGEALSRLTDTYQELHRHLYNERNELRNFVNVYVNDEDIRHASRLDTPLKDGDTLTIVPAIAGGVRCVRVLR
jgi:MoaD family protein